MKRERGRYYKGDVIRHRAWRTKGTITGVPDKWSNLAYVTVQWENGSTQEVWVPSIILDEEYVKKLVIEMGLADYIPEVGTRVKVKSLGIKGTIEYVSVNEILASWFNPIQILLDKPYDDSGQRMYRTSLRDIKILNKKEKDKPKKKKKKAPEPVEEIIWEDETSDDDGLIWDEEEEMEWD